jgi:hypothetical protein
LDPPEDVVEDKPLPTHPSQMKIVEKPPMPLVEMAEKAVVAVPDKSVVPVVQQPTIPPVETQSKEESKALPKLDTEAASASVQPPTPTVTSPTPPVTPADPDAPIPPKRKPGKSTAPKGKPKK